MSGVVEFEEELFLLFIKNPINKNEINPIEKFRIILLLLADKLIEIYFFNV